jgi:hypothetical protein
MGTRCHLVVRDDVVELREGGEAEEDVDDVGRQLNARLPLLAKYPQIRRKTHLENSFVH